MRALVASCLACLSALCACSLPAGAPSDSGSASGSVLSGKPSVPMNLSSPAFGQGDTIPVRYTCDGENISPALSVSGVPAEAKSLALVMDDPDVPRSLRPDGLFVHWVLADIAPSASELPTGANAGEFGTPGRNTRGDPVYTGPCPPDREHRYFFRLYALDTRLGLSSAPTKEELEKAMEGHIIAEATLMGRYDRAR